MSDTVTIFHHPLCSKSRATLALLKEKNLAPNIVLYMENPLTLEQITTLLNQLGFDSARQLIRTKEALYAELNLDQATEQQLIDAMIAYPKLIERPIVVVGNRARLGRPPEKVLEIL